MRVICAVLLLSCAANQQLALAQSNAGAAINDDSGNANDSCQDESDCVTGICQDIPFLWDRTKNNMKFKKKCRKGKEGAPCNDVNSNCFSRCCVDGKCAAAHSQGFGTNCQKECQCLTSYPLCKPRIDAAAPRLTAVKSRPPSD